MITLSESARKKLIAGAEELGSDIIFGVRGGGCAGMSYNIDSGTGNEEYQFIQLENDIKLWIEPEAIPFTENLMIDWVTNLTGSGFVFNNPIASSTCGCGTSFAPKEF